MYLDSFCMAFFSKLLFWIEYVKYFGNFLLLIVILVRVIFLYDFVDDKLNIRFYLIFIYLCFIG